MNEEWGEVFFPTSYFGDWGGSISSTRASPCSSSRGELGFSPSFRSIGNIDLEEEQSTHRKVGSDL